MSNIQGNLFSANNRLQNNFAKSTPISTSTTSPFQMVSTAFNTELPEIQASGSNQLASVNQALTTQATAPSGLGEMYKSAQDMVNRWIDNLNTHISSLGGDMNWALDQSKKSDALNTDAFRAKVNSGFFNISNSHQVTKSNGQTLGEYDYIMEPIRELGPNADKATIDNRIWLSQGRMEERLKLRRAVSTDVNPSPNQNPNGDSTAGFVQRYNELTGERGTSNLGMTFLAANRSNNPDWNAFVSSLWTGDLQLVQPKSPQSASAGLSANEFGGSPEAFINNTLSRLDNVLGQLLQGRSGLQPPFITDQDRAEAQSHYNSVAIFGDQVGGTNFALSQIINKKMNQYDLQGQFNSQTGQYEFFDIHNLQFSGTRPVNATPETSPLSPTAIDTNEGPQTALRSMYNKAIEALNGHVQHHTGQGIQETGSIFDGIPQEQWGAKLRELAQQYSVNRDDNNIWDDGRIRNFDFLIDENNLPAVSTEKLRTAGNITTVPARASLDEQLNVIESAIRQTLPNFTLNRQGITDKTSLEAALNQSLNSAGWDNNQWNTFGLSQLELASSQESANLPAGQQLNGNINNDLTVLNNAVSTLTNGQVQLNLPAASKEELNAKLPSLGDLVESVKATYAQQNATEMSGATERLVDFLESADGVKKLTGENFDFELVFTGIGSGPSQPAPGATLHSVTFEAGADALFAAINESIKEVTNHSETIDVATDARFAGQVTAIRGAFESKDINALNAVIGGVPGSNGLVDTINTALDLNSEDFTLAINKSFAKLEDKITDGPGGGDLNSAQSVLAKLSEVVTTLSGQAIDLNNLPQEHALHALAEGVKTAFATGSAEQINTAITPLVAQLNTTFDVANGRNIEITFQGLGQGEATVKIGTKVPVSGDPNKADSEEAFDAINSAVRELLPAEFSGYEIRNVAELQQQRDAVVQAFAANNIDTINSAMTALVQGVKDTTKIPGGAALTLSYNPASQGEPATITTQQPRKLFGDPNTNDATETLTAINDTVKELLGDRANGFDLNNLQGDLATKFQGPVDALKAAYTEAETSHNYQDVNAKLKTLISAVNEHFTASGISLNISASDIKSGGIADYHPEAGAKFSEPIFAPEQPAIPAGPDGFTEMASVGGIFYRKELEEPERDRPHQRTVDFKLDHDSMIALSDVFNEGHPEEPNPNDKSRTQMQWDEAHFVRILDEQGKVVAEHHSKDFSPNSKEILLADLQKKVTVAGINVDITADPATFPAEIKDEMSSIFKELDAAFKIKRDERFDELEVSTKKIVDLLNKTYNPQPALAHRLIEDAWITGKEEYPDLVLPKGNYKLQIIHESAPEPGPNGEKITAASRHIYASIFARPVDQISPGEITGTAYIPSVKPGEITPELSTPTVTPGSVSSRALDPVYGPMEFTPSNGVPTFIPGDLTGKTTEYKPGTFDFSLERATKKGGLLSSQRNDQVLTDVTINGNSSGATLKPAEGIHSSWYHQVDTPLVLDVANAGVENLFTSQEDGVEFDLNGDGIKEKTSWTKAQGDKTGAFLTLDTDGSGSIDSGKELFGGQNGDADGFERLAQFDENKDGVISQQDAVYSELKLWQDKNHDGVSQTNEMKTLAEMGITSLNTRAELNSQSDQFGNGIGLQSLFTRQDGSTGTIVDAFFNTDANTAAANAAGISHPINQPPRLRQDNYFGDKPVVQSKANTVIDQLFNLMARLIQVSTD